MFINISSYTPGLASSPPSVHLLFTVHILLFPLTLASGFIIWTVVRTTEKLHTPVNYLLAAWSVVNCVLGTASALTSIVYVSGNGIWRYGNHSCVLHQSLVTSLHCGAGWTLATILIYILLQQANPKAYIKYIAMRYKRLIPIMVWLGAISQSLVAVFISHTGYYTTPTDYWPLGKCANNSTTKGNAIFMTISSFICPTVLMIGLYMRILMRAGRPLTQKVRPEVGMAMEGRLQRSADDWQDMGEMVMSAMEGRQCQGSPAVIRSVSSRDGGEVGVTLSGCPDLLIPHQRTLTPARPTSSATRPRSSEQLVEVGSEMGPEMFNSGMGEEEEKEQHEEKKLQQVDGLEERMQEEGHGGQEKGEEQKRWKNGQKQEQTGRDEPRGLQQEEKEQHQLEDRKEGKNPKRKAGIASKPLPPQNKSFTYPPLRIPSMLPPSPGTLSYEIGSLESEPLHRRSRDEMFSSGNDGLKRLGSYSTHHRFSTSPPGPSPKNSYSSGKFFYSRDSPLTDSHNWPTIFLTADNLDQVDQWRDAPDVTKFEKVPNMAPALMESESRNKEDRERADGGHEIRGRQDRAWTGDIREDVKNAHPKALLLLLVPHMLLWLPYQILLMMVITDAVEGLDFVSYVTMETIGKLTLVLNPLLYLLFCSEFRSSLWSIMHCRDPNIDTEIQRDQNEKGRDYGCPNLNSMEGQHRRLFTHRNVMLPPIPTHVYPRKVSPLYSPPFYGSK